MRVLVAPDKFAGTLTAVEAAEAIAEGWRRRSPGDELDPAHHRILLMNCFAQGAALMAGAHASRPTAR